MWPKADLRNKKQMIYRIKVLTNCLLVILLLVSCTTKNEEEILPGAYQLEEYLPLLSGKKVGFYGNHTSLINGTHTIDSLLAHQINITTVFSPEHGIKGNAADGEIIEIQPHKYDFKLFSLYGRSKKPTKEQLANTEVLLVDIQDVGVRFYTYSSTLTYLMDKCAELNIPVIILDRPNPNGSYVAGPVLDSCCYSIVGMHPIPVVYGLTLGELAIMINEEGWLSDKNKVNLKVIPVKNWKHDTFYSLPVRPSPNLPNNLSVALYPSLALFEGSKVSIGRGTEMQFQVIGHPLIRDSSFSFKPTPNLGSKYPKLEGELCFGQSFVNTKITYEFNINYFIDYYNLLENELGEDFFKPYISKLIGNKIFQQQIASGMSAEEIKLTWEPQLSEFKILRNKYLLYE